MSKEISKNIQQMGIPHEQYLKMIGLPLRRRSNFKATQVVQSEKKQIKKKPHSKKQTYIPPAIVLSQVAKVMDYEWFKSCITHLFEYSNTTQQKFMSIQKMYQIYKKAADKGGVVQVSSINEFTSIAQEIIIMAGPNHIHQEVNKSFIEKIRQMLFSVQFIHKNQGGRKLYQLGLINFVSKEQLKQMRKDKLWGLNYFNFDLTLFQEGAKGIQIDPQIFNLQYMCEHYGKQKIDIRIQNPLDFGFKPSKLKNKKYQMSLNDYRFYQLNFEKPDQMSTFKHTEHLGKGQVFFGVNFQPNDQMLNKQMKKYVSQTFLDFHGNFDLLSYLDNDVPGCSLPQMYFKVPGCWTGGHQQNICMSALNINHGPGYSQWYTLELKYIQKLRKQLIQKFGTDLYSSEGLWYQKLDWFIQKGYPVKRFLQRTDDIVVTGPGTLHWVRSFGVALQTSWNIFPKNYEQFQAAFCRHKVNNQIKFSKSDTIPFKSLVLKYLNHQRTTMLQKTRILCINKIQQWLEQEKRVLQKINSQIQERQYFYLKDLQSFCSLCKQQVLIYFIPAPFELQKGISCLHCYQKTNENKKQIQTLYYKLDILFLDKLINICKNEQLNKFSPNQIQELCKGIHVGEISIKCTVKQKIQDQKKVKENSVFRDQNQIKSAQRQIIQQDKQKMKLNEHLSQKNKQQRQQSHNKGRLKPHQKKYCGKMMMQIQQQPQLIPEQIQIQKKIEQSHKQSVINSLKNAQNIERQHSSDNSKMKKNKKIKKNRKKRNKVNEKQQLQQSSSNSQRQRQRSSSEQRKVKVQEQKKNKNKDKNSKIQQKNNQGKKKDIRKSSSKEKLSYSCKKNCRSQLKSAQNQEFSGQKGRKRNFNEKLNQNKQVASKECNDNNEEKQVTTIKIAKSRFKFTGGKNNQSKIINKNATINKIGTKIDDPQNKEPNQ